MTKQILSGLAIALLTSAIVPACGGGDCGSPLGGGDDCGGDAAEELNNSIQGSYTLDDPETDTSIGVSSNDSGGTTGASPGGMVNVALQFNAPNGNVVGGGIRFGTSGPVHVVTIPDVAGATSGTLNFAVPIPDSVCDNLSSICHDIKCYEFAVTDVGKVSTANINDIALQCGNCDEPSCQDLLDECETGTGFTPGSYAGNWSGNCDSFGAVSGTWQFSVDDGGSVMGSYSGDDAGPISGTVGSSGQLSASGGAGGSCQWTGGQVGGAWNGSWSCSNGCAGSWGS